GVIGVAVGGNPNHGIVGTRRAAAGRACSWRLACHAGLDRETRGAPFRKTLLEPQGREATPAQQRHRFEGQHAIGTAAVSEAGAISRQLTEPAWQLPQRYADRMRQMAGREFIAGSDIEERHHVILQAPRQLVSRYRLEGIQLAEVTVDHFAHLRQVTFSYLAE